MYRSPIALGLMTSVFMTLPALTGCSDGDDTPESFVGSGGSGATAGSGGSPGRGGSAGDGGTGGSAGSGTQATSFKLKVENVSGDTALPTPISPGIWVTSTQSSQLFSVGQPDRGLGLEALAEDGDPSLLQAAIDAAPDIRAGTFDTPFGGAQGPALPGQAFEVDIEARPGDRLALATMFAQSNDVVIATPLAGIALFDDAGAPLPERDISDQLALWDVGTEKDEAPGLGLAQAPRQPSMNFGPSERRISERIEPTRTLPTPQGLISIDVVADGASHVIYIENVSVARGVAKTPIAPVFFATHSNEVMLFAPGAGVSAGLESLAEDGDAQAFADEQAGRAGIGAVGAAGTAPIMPGEKVSLSITPSPEAPRLSLAMMIAESNDLFIATRPEGVALYDSTGNFRPSDDVERDLEKSLAIWDAGTEANEVPGVGKHQAPRQLAPDTGPADPITHVRLYADTTNDLDATNVRKLAKLSVQWLGGMTYQLTLSNVSGSSAFPGILSPTSWVLHDGATALFGVDEAASPGIEALAEDGDAAKLDAEIAQRAGVGAHGVAGTAPFASGQSVVFTVTASPTHRFVNLASMVVPSNDTFVSLGRLGLELVTAAGSPRTAAQIAQDATLQLKAYDAGTEQNQASAIGPDMAGPGLQVAPDTGPADGHGTVRLVTSQIWPFASAAQIVRVTVSLSDR